jgi:hypothetical protein
VRRIVMTRALRFIFVVYVIALFVATHWPRLSVPGAGFRVDLVIHAGVFGLWNVLLMLTAWLGPRLSWRNLLASTLVAALASMGDEFSQSLPWFDRQFGFDDMTANLVGVFTAAIVVGWITRKAISSGKKAHLADHQTQRKA